MAKKTTTTKKSRAKNVPAKNVIAHNNNNNVHSKILTTPKPPQPHELTAEGIFEMFRGAKISTDRQQPKRMHDVFVEIEGENGTETHLVDMRQCPQEIIDTWEGELV